MRNVEQRGIVSGDCREVFLGLFSELLTHTATCVDPAFLSYRDKWMLIHQLLLGHPPVRGFQRPIDFPLSNLRCQTYDLCQILMSLKPKKHSLLRNVTVFDFVLILGVLLWLKEDDLCDEFSGTIEDLYRSAIMTFFDEAGFSHFAQLQAIYDLLGINVVERERQKRKFREYMRPVLRNAPSFAL